MTQDEKAKIMALIICTKMACLAREDFKQWDELESLMLECEELFYSTVMRRREIENEPN